MLPHNPIAFCLSIHIQIFNFDLTCAIWSTFFKAIWDSYYFCLWSYVSIFIEPIISTMIKQAF